MKQKSINLKLRSLRLKYGYSYGEMAKKIGICIAYYWQLEHNNRRLYYDVAVKIAKIFELKPDDIFFEKIKK